MRMFYFWHPLIRNSEGTRSLYVAFLQLVLADQCNVVTFAFLSRTRFSRTNSKHTLLSLSLKAKEPCINRTYSTNISSFLHMPHTEFSFRSLSLLSGSVVSHPLFATI